MRLVELARTGFRTLSSSDARQLLGAQSRLVQADGVYSSVHRSSRICSCHGSRAAVYEICQTPIDEMEENLATDVTDC